MITQPFDHQSESYHVESVLRAEYALLCIADAFKAEFDINVKTNKVGNVPSKLLFLSTVGSTNLDPLVLSRILF